MANELVGKPDVRPTTLILGIGNTLLRDEGVGVHVVERMRGMTFPTRVELLDGGTSGAGLVDEIANRRKLIVIDAVEAGAAPGAVFRLSLDDLLQETDRLSLHAFGLADTVKMAQHLGCAPGQVVIFGIQPKEVRIGLELSPEIAAIVPEVIRHVLCEVTGEGP